MNDMDAAEKEIYAEAKFKREKAERLDKAFGRAWRIGAVWAVVIAICSPIFGAARGCAAKPDTPAQCIESSIIYTNNYFLSHSGYNGGDKCHGDGKMTVNTIGEKVIITCTCPNNAHDAGIHE